jgi:hypothetical protein
MPIDVADSTSNVATAATGAIAMPIAPVTNAMNLDPAQKKMAEFGLKAKKLESDDPTDDDVSNMFELVKLAIQNGATVTDIDLKAFIPHFQEEVKLKTKKYTNAKIVSFFTGGTFTFLMYLLIEYLKTL